MELRKFKVFDGDECIKLSIVMIVAIKHNDFSVTNFKRKDTRISIVKDMSNWKRVVKFQGRYVTLAEYDRLVKKREGQNQRVQSAEREEYDFTYRKNQCSNCDASIEFAMPSGYCGNCGSILTQPNRKRESQNTEPDFEIRIFQKGTDQSPPRRRG